MWHRYSVTPYSPLLKNSRVIFRYNVNHNYPDSVVTYIIIFSESLSSP